MNYKIIENPDQILEVIQTGTHLPVLPELKKYIRFDLVDLKCKSLVIYSEDQENKPIGHTLVFPINQQMLGFGYFNVQGNREDIISTLISLLISYAKDCGCSEIYGPLNVPIYIFGFGFLQEEAKPFIYGGHSFHLPIYHQLFEKHGFEIKMKYRSYEVVMVPINPYALPNLDFSDYKMCNPQTREEFDSVKGKWLDLHAMHMPSEIRLTPNPQSEVSSLVDYVFEFGYNYLLFWIEYMKSGEFVAAGAVPPNCFHLWEKGPKLGHCKSYLGFDFVVAKDHRNKKLSILMWGDTTTKGIEKGRSAKLNYLVEEDNTYSIKIIQRFGGVHKYTYLLMKLKI
jgi:hypothetical protein